MLAGEKLGNERSDMTSDNQECGSPVAADEVAKWAQSVLTALNVGDIKSGSPLHLKLREVMIAYRDHFEAAKECDHDWEVVDDSFDHEYGCERIVFERCALCDEERPHEPQRFDDDVM